MTGSAGDATLNTSSEGDTFDRTFSGTTGTLSITLGHIKRARRRDVGGASRIRVRGDTLWIAEATRFHGRRLHVVSLLGRSSG